MCPIGLLEPARTTPLRHDQFGTFRGMSIARNGDVEIYYEAIGPAGPPVLLMVNGLGSQCINYSTEWCERFVARGLQVIRFDNRDVGLSTHLTDAPVDERNACYRLSDMADDAIAVLDAADVQRAHVMGLSMGGMIVQQLAIDHRDRLLSVTSVMSSTGEPEYGQSTPEAYALLTGAPATDRASAIERHIAGLRVWGSPEFADEERWAADAGRAFDRNFDPAGVGRQFFAVGASGSRADALRSVTTPTLVIHGSADTLITPSGGERTAELIPGARFELIEGMGHDYPPQLWDTWVDLVCGHIETVGAA
jgi:pimeloyl-ACP methyl ester carboxylesterase